MGVAEETRIPWISLAVPAVVANTAVAAVVALVAVVAAIFVIAPELSQCNEAGRSFKPPMTVLVATGSVGRSEVASVVPAIVLPLASTVTFV